MFNILSFLQGGWPMFEKGGIEKSRGTIYKAGGGGGIRPPRKLCHMAQGLSKAYVVCPYVCLLTTFHKISTLDVSNFFCMWLRIFNLQKFMQFNFRGRFTLLHKGPKLWFSCFFFPKNSAI